MGTSRDPSVRVSSSDQFGSTPGGICVKFSTSHILLWHVLRLKVWYQSNQSGFIVSTDACCLFFSSYFGSKSAVEEGTSAMDFGNAAHRGPTQVQKG